MTENKRIEFKREIPKKSYKIHNELVALSNSGGGKLFLGRNDDGTVYKGKKELKTIDIWKMLNSFCDTYMSKYIQEYWSIENDPEGNGKVITCSPSPIPFYTFRLGEKTYFHRFQTECKEISENEIKAVFNEATPTLLKYDPTNFSNLMELNPALSEKRVLEAYGVVSSDYVTYVGTYFQNDSKLQLSLGVQKFNFWGMDNLIKTINDKYAIVQNIGLIRISVSELYKAKVEDIIRELLSNAITHSLIGSEIKVSIDNHSMTVSNDALDKELINMVSRGKIEHMTKNINRQRLLEFSRMMEGHSNGFNKVIRKHTIDNDIITLFRIDGRRLEIKTILVKTLTKPEKEELAQLAQRKSLNSISRVLEDTIGSYLEKTPKIKIKGDVKIW